MWIPKNKTELKQHLSDPLFANAYFLMANTLLSAGAGFFFWILAARLYSAEAVGLGSALISAAGLIGTLSLLGFDIGLIRYLSQEKNKSGMINSCLTITAFTATMLAIVFLLGLNIWAPALSVLRENFILLSAFILFTITSSLYVLQANVFVAFRQAKYSFMQNLLTVLRIGILPLFGAFGAFGIYSSAGLASLIALVTGNILILKVYSSYRPAPAIRRGVINDMLHYSSGNYVARVFEQMPIFVLPIIVVNVLGAEMNAYFYVAWEISLILYVIPLATSTSLLAEGSYSPNELRKNVIKALKFTSILLIPAILGVFIFGKYVLLLFGKEYAENSYEILLILSIASIPYTVNSVYATMNRVQKEIMPVILVYVVIAGITIGGGYFLMQSIGLIGIGIAWVIGNGIAAGGVGVKVALKNIQ